MRREPESESHGSRSWEEVKPSERERRITAAARAFYAPADSTWIAPTVLTRNVAAALDAADEAVPVVSAEVYALVLGECQKERQSAEAAASDFARALVAARAMLIREFGERDPLAPWDFVDDALARHPSFSGEEGIEG